MRLELIVSIAPDVPNALLGDPLRLRQVLLNLIGNAIKIYRNGEVLISVERESSPSDFVHLKFSVRDTGIGIAKDKIPVLFAAFEQADTSTARKYGGSGLGLANRQAHCRSHAGEVTLESEPGKGSVFSFISPFELEPNPPAAERWPDLGHFPVLIVDRNQARARGGAPDAKRSRRNIYGSRVLRGRHHRNRAGPYAGQPPRLVLLGDRIARKHLRQWSSSLRRRRSVRRRSSR